MNYRNRIAGLQREAEANFRNAGGFTGINYPRNFRNAGGQMAPAASEVLDTNDRTWTMTVVNAATTAKTAMLFGSTKDLTDATNTTNQITVTVSESSHLQVKTCLLTEPVRILGLRYTVTTAAQFSNVLSLIDEKTTGAYEKRLFQPLNYRSNQQYIATQIDAMSFELLLTPTTYITFTMNGSETVTFTFTIVEKAQLHNVLRNAPVVATSNTPAPTGLVQVDMPRGV
jgi:hypothetical protein